MPTSPARNRIYAFDQAKLRRALETWKQKQLAAYPHRQERIETTVLAMLDFFEDPDVLAEHKLVTGTSAPVPPAPSLLWDDPLAADTSADAP